jgi:hypothetical protein
MSLSEILVPNTYNLYGNIITGSLSSLRYANINSDGTIAANNNGITNVTHVPLSGIYEVFYDSHNGIIPVVSVCPYTLPPDPLTFGNVVEFSIGSSLSDTSCIVYMVDYFGTPVDWGFGISLMG